MHHTAFVPYNYSVTAGCSLSDNTDALLLVLLMSDHGYLLIQAIFQALQLYSWGFALIKLFQNCNCCRNSTLLQAW